MSQSQTLKMDYYELLRQKMDTWPTRTPKSAGIIKILKELYTEEEAELLSYFEGHFSDLASPIEFAERINKPVERIVELFNSLAKRGLLLKIGRSRKRAKSFWWSLSKTASRRDCLSASRNAIVLAVSLRRVF